MRTKLLIPGLWLAMTCPWAQAQSPSVAQALLDQQWDTALSLAQTLPGAELERQAQAAAAHDVVPAMWLMGQARYLQHDLDGASRWFYRGWLGLQIDLNVCRSAASRNLTAVLMSSFPDALTHARNDVAVRTTGIRDAARYYGDDPNRDPLTGWSCRWAFIRQAKGPQPTPQVLARLTIDDHQYRMQRARALDQFMTQTGLQSRTAHKVGASANLELP